MPIARTIHLIQQIDASLYHGLYHYDSKPKVPTYLVEGDTALYLK